MNASEERNGDQYKSNKLININGEKLANGLNRYHVEKYMLALYSFANLYILFSMTDARFDHIRLICVARSKQIRCQLNRDVEKSDEQK